MFSFLRMLPCTDIIEGQFHVVVACLLKNGHKIYYIMYTTNLKFGFIKCFNV